MKNRILFLLADGFEEMEAVIPFDILSRGGISATLASIHEDAFVEGAHGLSVRADALLSELSPSDFDGVFIPGGSRGVENLKSSEPVLEIVRDFAAAGKWVFSICAGPMVLARAGILHDRRITSYPSTEKDLILHCKAYSADRVVVDNRVVTSRGPGSAEEFGFAVLELLTDRRTVQEVRTGMLARPS
jgi:DJ-1 family protein